MGIKDTRTKEFVKDNRRFADVCNYYLYGGRNVIRPEHLRERDTAEIANIPVKQGKAVAIQKFRDLLKGAVLKESDKALYLLIGIENQSDVHYAIAVKNMLYDSINYWTQIMARTKINRNNKEHKRTSAEFISGFAKEDRLIPVITITIYWGAGKWDGPRSIHDMFHTEDEAILKYAQDYKVNLIVPEEIEDFRAFTTDIGYTLDCIKHSGSMEELMEFFEKNKEIFSAIDEEAADVISECVGIKISDEDRKGGKVNMSKGAQELLEYGIEQGRIEIAITLLKDGNEVKEVSRITKLSIEKVEELKKTI